MAKYLEPLEVIKLQKLNKDFYDNKAGALLQKVTKPSAFIVLERSRNEIHIGYWKRNTRELSTQRILKIGDGDDCNATKD